MRSGAVLRKRSARTRKRLTSIAVIFCAGMAVGSFIGAVRGYATVTPQYDSTAGSPLLQLRHYSTDAMFEGGA